MSVTSQRWLFGVISMLKLKHCEFGGFSFSEHFCFGGGIFYQQTIVLCFLSRRVIEKQDLVPSDEYKTTKSALVSVTG